MEHFQNGVHGIPVIIEIQHLSDNFRICFRYKRIALFDQFITQRNIIFNNAIMYNSDGVVFIKMRMGIYIIGNTMGSPPGMADSHCTGHGFSAMGQLFQYFQPAHRFGHIDRCTVKHCHSG